MTCQGPSRWSRKVCVLGSAFGYNLYQVVAGVKVPASPPDGISTDAEKLRITWVNSSG